MSSRIKIETEYSVVTYRYAVRVNGKKIYQAATILLCDQVIEAIEKTLDMLEIEYEILNVHTVGI